MTSPIHQPLSFRNPVLWATFVVYLVITGFTLAHHEMWADELHSWNIAKGSKSFPDIFRNSRYEGHPPLWYIILWTIAQCTHDLAAVRVVHWLIAAVPVFLLLFYSRIPVSTRVLIPFGYFFLFEYAVISRNYAIGILLACFVCLVMRKNFRYKTVLYYTLLLLLANTHLLGTLLAGSLHIYFLLWQMQQKKGAGMVAAHVLLGLLVALPAVYFILPPAGSALNAQVQTGSRLGIRAKTFMQVPLRSFLPMPAWWNYNWWNTQCLVQAKENVSFIRYTSLAIAIALPVYTWFVFRSDKKCLALFFTNFIFSVGIALTVLTLGSARYTGFIFLAFVLALWLYCDEHPLGRWKKISINALLLVQAMAGMFAVVKDIELPFSNAYRVQELLQQVPPGKKLVADYWAVNTYAAYIDKPVYCLDLQMEADKVLFDRHQRRILTLHNRYAEGMKVLNARTGLEEVYLFSTNPPETISRIDPQMEFRLIGKREGAMEKFSNLYLYIIKMPARN